MPAALSRWVPRSVSDGDERADALFIPKRSRCPTAFTPHVEGERAATTQEDTMRLSRRPIAIALATLAATATLAVSSASASDRGAHDDGPEGHADAFTFAVIGDIPYGAAQIANFPHVIQQINADPTVQLVDHLGDIKSGSTVCSDEYFAQVKAQFDTFVDPLVYTVGDNEWRSEERRVGK